MLNQYTTGPEQRSLGALAADSAIRRRRDAFDPRTCGGGPNPEVRAGGGSSTAARPGMPMNMIATAWTCPPPRCISGCDIEISREHRTDREFASRVKLRRPQDRDQGTTAARATRERKGAPRTQQRLPAHAGRHCIGRRRQSPRPGELRELGSRTGHPLLAFLRSFTSIDPAQCDQRLLGQADAGLEEIENWWNERACLRRQLLGNPLPQSITRPRAAAGSETSCHMASAPSGS